MSGAAVLVDTCVWIDHFVRSTGSIAERLASISIVMHEFIQGELVLGAIPRNHPAADYIDAMPRLATVPHPMMMEFIRFHRLEGSGIGWIDAHLLASAKLATAEIWTTDRALRKAAQRCGVALTP